MATELQNWADWFGVSTWSRQSQTAATEGTRILRDKGWISKCEFCSIVSGIAPAPGRSRVRLALDYNKFHRPSADFFSDHPARRGVVRPRAGALPGTRRLPQTLFVAKVGKLIDFDMLP